MSPDEIMFLKSSIHGEPVNIRFNDGEELRGIIHYVLEDIEEVACTIIESNRIEKYENYESKTIVFPFNDIASVDKK